MAAGAATITLTSVSGLQYPGIIVVDRQNVNGTDTPTVREYISYTGISSSNLTGCVRGLGGSTDQTHTSGALVEEVFTVTHWNTLLTNLLNVLAADGSLDTTKVIDASSTQTMTNKTLTSPVINTPTGDVSTLTGTQTLTNKRITKRILSAASYTTDTGTSLNCDTLDEFIVTAQAGALKLNNPTGTPTDGQLLLVAITGTGAQALTYDTQFEASTVSLPTTTVTTARLNMLFIWAASRTKWVILASS